MIGCIMPRTHATITTHLLLMPLALVVVAYTVCSDESFVAQHEAVAVPEIRCLPTVVFGHLSLLSFPIVLLAEPCSWGASFLKNTTLLLLLTATEPDLA